MVELDGLTYRVLGAAEWKKAWPLLKDSFGEDFIHNFPDPEMSVLMVAEDGEGNVVGCCFLQPIIHAEPYCAVPGAGVHLEGFRQVGVEVVPKGGRVYLMVHDDPRALDSVSQLNFQRVPGVVLHQMIV